jgi:hypothetical protein
VRDRLVSDCETYETVADLDGISPLVWRQGLKHDCARIMELDRSKGTQINGNGNVVDVESEWVYGLLKSSDLRDFEATRPRKQVIITQRCLGEETTQLQHSAPKLWSYLIHNSEYFERRKSSIYRHLPRFAIFGVGEYSFAPYKVAISGLYKEPRFSLVLPVEDRPVMLDDTCYFLGFDNYLDALWTASLLNSPTVMRFLASIVFLDAKRPYTKEILMRIDLVRAAARIPYRELLAAWADRGYQPRVRVSESDYEAYRERLTGSNRQWESLQLKLGI